MPKADVDPLALALLPPKDESPAQKAARLAAEQEATRISNLIDSELRAERAQLKKEAQNQHKILLLGQAEAGKSTVLKQFQLVFTPNQFRAQQQHWKALVQLNLVRSILVICEALTDDPSEYDLDIDNFLSLDPTVSPDYSIKAAESLLNEGGDEDDTRRNSYPYPGTANAEIGPIPEITVELRQLKMRLSPLYHVQTVLIEHLACQFDDPSLLVAAHQLDKAADGAKTADFVVRSNTSLNGFLGKKLGRTDEHEQTQLRLDIHEVNTILRACRNDMIALWKDPTVREILHRRDVRLEEGPGFFLHEIERITEPNYVPSQDDVFRARIRTLGVQEYSFRLETGPDKGREWRLYDCGGARNQRHSWPFFDDCHIIFLAPISCFDQVLAEDRRINRLEDSMQLWKAVCSSKLLQNSEMVLFLNKCDILEAKLKSGSKFSDWVPQFDGANTVADVTKYLKGKFRSIQKAHSPGPRVFYCHLTAVTDAKSTAKILNSVQELVTRVQLQSVSLL
ncbi:related to guanine nucleotide-binding protein alpha-4 subunit [Serendipita indica DSM 11827]|uniref:Related to guanine nucleotide-binding protein alpha-4 subunit n=1 Tax=Serendipita indica (strain DSM 11827) TaxID=1109443 RepID=G4T790_SERID|nr:related to guanine nucleotide-binding protein alpha-4 subunit [Serendipita indica DSM 11827]